MSKCLFSLYLISKRISLRLKILYDHTFDSIHQNKKGIKRRNKSEKKKLRKFKLNNQLNHKKENKNNKKKEKHNR